MKHESHPKSRAINQRMSMADPIHGIIQFDRQNETHALLLEIMNAKAFQRLRRIKQMGLAEFVFPGATHSRFIHSLGAVHLMMKAIEHFNNDPESSAILKSHYEDTNIPLERLLLVSILIHDIGHTPLSHTLEDILELRKQGLLHDHYWNRRILTEDPELQSIWQKFHPDMPQALLAFMGEGPEGPRKKHYLAYLVSSQLDMDRLDYLQRDSHYLGVQYGRVEAQRIISSLVISKLPHGQPVVAVREEAIPAIEHYLFGRYQAYKMALHSLDKASEAVLRCVLKRFVWARQNNINTGHPAEELFQLMQNGHAMTTDQYLRMDDCYLWEVLSHWAYDAEDELLKSLASHMLKHQLFKFIDLKKFGYDQSLESLPEVYSALKTHYESRGLSFEFGFDESEVKLKPMYLPPEDREPIWIWTFRGPVVDLRDISAMPLSVMPEKGQKQLVFVWDKKAKRFLLEQLEKQFPKMPDRQQIELALDEEENLLI